MNPKSIRKLSEHEKEGTDWEGYYKIVDGRPVREFLRNHLRRFETPGQAIDLGCGAGVETFYLLDQGWQVLAIDQTADALRRVTAGAPPAAAGRLETRQTGFENLEMPPTDLVWAGLSLPFCRPEHFDSLWRKIGDALRPGGRFMGDFFGPDHAWADSDEMTFLTKEAVLERCEGLHLEYLLEGKGEQRTASQGIVDWHMFTISVRK